MYKKESYKYSMKVLSYSYYGIILIVLLTLLTSCGTFTKMTDREKELNYEIDKAYLEYTYKRDSLIIEYNK